MTPRPPPKVFCTLKYSNLLLNTLKYQYNENCNFSLWNGWLKKADSKWGV
jgi:hypothetical protein